MEHINIQPVEKRVNGSDGTVLDVHSTFYTIQGEGPFCGTPAVFVRLAGCNLQCPGCDTDYTSTREQLSIETIERRISIQFKAVQFRTRRTYDVPQLVVITGGEPFRQNLGKLIPYLLELGYYVQIETNGTLPPPDIVFSKDTSWRSGAFIVCSPKTGSVHPLTSVAACCFKYVLDARSVDPEDGLPVLALGHTAAPKVARPPEGTTKDIYLQPADSRNDEQNKANMEAVVRSCLRYGYILQLQVHKIIEVE